MHYSRTEVLIKPIKNAPVNGQCIPLTQSFLHATDKAAVGTMLSVLIKGRTRHPLFQYKGGRGNKLYIILVPKALEILSY